MKRVLMLAAAIALVSQATPRRAEAETEMTRCIADCNESIVETWLRGWCYILNCLDKADTPVN